MAKNFNNKTTMFINMALMLSLLVLLVAIAESRSILGDRPFKKSTPTCETVVSHESGETCFSIAEAHKLDTETFNSINPNINCDRLFVGQWVCVKGTP